MSDLFTDVVPTEPGMYWIRDKKPGGATDVAQCCTHGGYFNEHFISCFDVPAFFQFGPRIPSAEGLAELTKKAAAFDLIASGQIRYAPSGSQVELWWTGSFHRFVRPTLIEAIRAAIAAEKGEVT